MRRTDRPRAHAHGLAWHGQISPQGGMWVCGCAWEMSSACYTTTLPSCRRARGHRLGRRRRFAHLVPFFCFCFLPWLLAFLTWISQPLYLYHTILSQPQAGEPPPPPKRGSAMTLPFTMAPNHSIATCYAAAQGPRGEQDRHPRRSRPRPAEVVLPSLLPPPPNQGPRSRWAFLAGLMRPHRT